MLKESLAQVVLMRDLIEYQDESIVSRTIIDKDAGTVTLFAFDAAQGLSEHSAPYDALVYLLEGMAIVTISGKPYSVKEGQMIIMPANDPHAVQASTRLKMLLTMIRS